MENIIIHPTTGHLGKKINLEILKNEFGNIQSISSIYQKIDNQYRYKITVIVSKEEHYEDF